MPLPVRPALSAALIALTCAYAEAVPGRFTLAGEYMPLRSYGAALGYETPKGYAFQAEFFRRQEFGPLSGSLSPLERYAAYTVHAGVVGRKGSFAIGAFTGAGYFDGVIRGKLLYHDSGGCDMWCTGPSSTFEPIHASDPVLPFVLEAGWNGRTLGWSFRPHVYYLFTRGGLTYSLPFALVFPLPF